MSSNFRVKNDSVEYLSYDFRQDQEEVKLKTVNGKVYVVFLACNAMESYGFPERGSKQGIIHVSVGTLNSHEKKIVAAAKKATKDANFG